MKDFPFFKFYVANALVETRHMSDAEIGRYTKKLIFDWMAGQTDVPWLADQIQNATKLSEVRTDAVMKRWLKSNKKDNSNTIVIQEYNNGNTDREIEEKKIDTKEISIVPNSRKSDYSPEFQEFWSLYPRAEKKGEAYKIWNKIKPPLQEIKKALEWQKQTEQWTKDNGKFIPHPTSYINAKRWEDRQQGQITEIILPVRWPNELDLKAIFQKMELSAEQTEKVNKFIQAHEMPKNMSIETAISQIIGLKVKSW